MTWGSSFPCWSWWVMLHLDRKFMQQTYSLWLGYLLKANLLSWERELQQCQILKGLHLTKYVLKDRKKGRLRLALCIHRGNEFKKGFKIRVPVGVMNHWDKLNSGRILHIVSKRWYLWHFWNVILAHFSIIWQRPSGIVQMQQQLTQLIFNYLENTEEGCRRHRSATEGEVVTETTWREPCDLYYGCRSVWLACVQF